MQRLRELVPAIDEEDDESLRDRLDAALAAAEDAGKAIRTLDAMLGEPQTLIPLDSFGEVLYAIIKEDTVVTVLPQGHGEEILQRGQAMEQRVANGTATLPNRPDEGERWDNHRRRWRREASQQVVVERIVRGATPNGGVVSRIESVGAVDPEDEARTATTDTDAVAVSDAPAKIVALPEPKQPDGPVANALHKALVRARRRAAVAALSEALSLQHREASLLPLWNELANEGVPEDMTVGDLLEAIRNVTPS